MDTGVVTDMAAATGWAGDMGTAFRITQDTDLPVLGSNFKICLLINVACFVGLVDARPSPQDEIDPIQEYSNTDAEDITQLKTLQPDAARNEPVKIPIPMLGDTSEDEAETESSSEVGTSSSINIPVGGTPNSLGGIAKNLNTIGGPPYNPTNYGAPYLDGYEQFGGDSSLGLGAQFGPQSAFGLQGGYDGYVPEAGFGPQSGFRYNQPGAFGQNFGSQASRLGIGSLGNFLSQFLVQFRRELLRSLGTLGN